ncbi:uncharacterized protein PFL1_04435 [Pseudozyma flocculosa PF-1]|uniref:Uncharacterized protein n=1 Tax=Pseudozyma flocculosa PF-1 TaxID=1277687 RepID=A0A061H668_9BASI|nr:uncharacterized protein PFL1_04435 [Pseudozyma flocculosa PF-1]EPQ28108.1 hypothetical protein PFL1_04435 [Pseudozyma flocculosa PF-1]
MAFIHHPRARPARDRHSPPPSHEPTSAPRASYSKTSQDNAHDWSIVFPGRVKQTATSAHDSDEPLSDSAASATPSSPADPFQPDPQTGLALSLPPLHDGTGRFAGASETSASPAADDVVSLRSPLSPQSDIYTESVFSATDSHDDADGEVGFGSGSDFESDAIAHADGEEKPSATARATPQESSLATSLGASRAGSWLSGNQSIASTLDHVSVTVNMATEAGRGD